MDEKNKVVFLLKSIILKANRIPITIAKIGPAQIAINTNIMGDITHKKTIKHKKINKIVTI